MKQSRDDLYRAIRQEVRFLRVEDSLLFLSRVLAASREEVQDATASAFLAQFQKPFPAFAIHLLAKLILKYGRRSTPKAMDWLRFMRVAPLAIQFCVDDPLDNSSDEAVGGYFIRMLSQQMDRGSFVQSHGLALGLFEDIFRDPATEFAGLRDDIEAALRMPVEMYIRFGLGAMSAAQAHVNGIKQPGTLNLGWLQKAQEDLPGIPWMEKWSDFARSVACTQREFNEMATQRAIDSTDSAYLAYEFNPLSWKPLIQTDEDHYICIDNYLLRLRTSWGIFEDVFALKRRGFAGPFGHAYQHFVGELLTSVIPQELLKGTRPFILLISLLGV